MCKPEITGFKQKKHPNTLADGCCAWCSILLLVLRLVIRSDFEPSLPAVCSWTGPIFPRLWGPARPPPPSMMTSQDPPSLPNLLYKPYAYPWLYVPTPGGLYGSSRVLSRVATLVTLLSVAIPLLITTTHEPPSTVKGLGVTGGAASHAPAAARPHLLRALGALRGPWGR